MNIATQSFYNSNGRCLARNIGQGSVAVSAEVQKLYRLLYAAARQLEEAEGKVRNIGELFQYDVEEKSANLVLLCKQIIFKDYQMLGKRVRDLMWRRGYYEIIAYVKKHCHRRRLHANTSPGNREKVKRFLFGAIVEYKHLAAKMEEIYDLDIKFLIDFSIIIDGSIGGAIVESARYERPVNANLQVISYALETIHSSLICLGDLHRYLLEFRLNRQLGITKAVVAKYYLEAFKLNPAIGMAQNQLGTLYSGQNYDLDSCYHYLYALVCVIPFSLSEYNLSKLFAKHTEYLKRSDPKKLEINLRDFYARFYLIVEILFYDKDVPDFNWLCYCVLVDFRKVLFRQQLHLDESSIFKIISILFFCLSKLKAMGSPKVYALHAFMVAACSHLLDACLLNIEQTVWTKSFDRRMRKSHNKPRNWRTAVGGKDFRWHPSPVGAMDCEVMSPLWGKSMKGGKAKPDGYDNGSDMDLDFYTDDEENAESWVKKSGNDCQIRSVKHLLAKGDSWFYGSEDVVIEEEKIRMEQRMHSQASDFEQPPPELLFRSRCSKIDPNIIIDCLRSEPTIRALKVLFDWLRIDPQILTSCYQTNPEFVQKIMKLSNYCNIDVFARKVYFERQLGTSTVRAGLAGLFDGRATVPLSEDFAFRNFDLFRDIQGPLDWEASLRERITTEEEAILRMFKIVDFGCFICKQKQLNYRFCIRMRCFQEAGKSKGKRWDRCPCRYSKHQRKRKNTLEESCMQPPPKGQPNRHRFKQAVTPTTRGVGVVAAAEAVKSAAENLKMEEDRARAMARQSEIMGQLWLQNEVETLEKELRDSATDMVQTPFVVLDAKALTEYNFIVKSLVRSRKCIVLIPNAVLNELDHLKKHSETVRRVIRWLEQEFKYGNCHLRAQRDNESRPLEKVKMPRQMEHDIYVFLQIAKFCNHLVGNYADTDIIDFQINVATYLAGDDLIEKSNRHPSFSYTDVLNSIPMRYDQIACFYDKVKRNIN